MRSLGSSLPPYLVVSLGTNDDPRKVTGVRAAVRTVLTTAGAGRCVVWLNIARPAAFGTTYAGYNRALVLEAAGHSNLRVVDWQRMVRRHPAWLRRDRVHVTAKACKADLKNGGMPDLTARKVGAHPAAAAEEPSS